jgi:hypothetical protein
MAKMRIEDYLKDHSEEMLAKAVKILKANVREKVYKTMAFDTLANRLGLIAACSDPEVPGWKGEPDDKGRVRQLIEKLVKDHPNIRERSFDRGYGRGLAFYPDHAIAREKLYGEIEDLLEKGMKDLERQLIAEGLLVEVTVKRFPDDEDDRTETELRVPGTTLEASLRVNRYRGAPHTSLDIERSYASTGLEVGTVSLVPVEIELMGELARAELRARIEMQKIRDKAQAKMDEIKARCNVKKG